MVSTAGPAGTGRLVPGTPCTVAASACVNLTDQRAWLISRGAVVLGPVPIHSGGPEHATPQGTFAVSWKDRNHVSRELHDMPMPDAVFFAAGGIAFHEGPLADPSAGCVHLRAPDAVAFYGALHRGDQVQVLAPGGDAASGAKAPVDRSGAGARVGVGPQVGTAGRPGAAGRGIQRGIPGVAPVQSAPPA
jgi:hypothetical protein